MPQKKRKEITEKVNYPPLLEKKFLLVPGESCVNLWTDTSVSLFYLIKQFNFPFPVDVFLICT